MTRTRILPTAAVLVALSLAGCGDDPAPTSDPTSAAVPSASAGEATAPANAGGLPPAPDAAAQAAYVDALRKIDPEIVGDKDQKALVNRGRDTCSSIASFPKDEAKLVDLTNQRFTAPGHPEGFGEAKAKKILAAVRTHICP
ncbi:hypothetical protein [Micromonospora chalcea]|uniref:hypothetical protein n=1 Tax=Micromonospora chalcea TaxID=1874 RepID=UPI0037A13740